MEPAATVTECGLKFELRLTHEEHIGLWLDSRPSRQLLQKVTAAYTARE